MKKEEILDIISDFGWYQNRKIDISYISYELKQSGFTVPNDLINVILEEFWNIKIEYKNIDGNYIDILLNVEEASGLTSALSNKKIEHLIKESIVPVATACCDSYLIWITYSGKFYLTGNRTIYYLCDNIIDTIDFILTTKKLIEFAKY